MRFFDRGVVVKAMDLVEVDIVHAQPRQAVVDLGQYGLAGQAGAIGPGRMRPLTLVASTISSRRACSPSTLPTISSLLPSE